MQRIGGALGSFQRICCGGQAIAQLGRPALRGVGAGPLGGDHLVEHVSPRAFGARACFSGVTVGLRRERPRRRCIGAGLGVPAIRVGLASVCLGRRRVLTDTDLRVLSALGRRCPAGAGLHGRCRGFDSVRAHPGHGFAFCSDGPSSPSAMMVSVASAAFLYCRSTVAVTVPEPNG